MAAVTSVAMPMFDTTETASDTLVLPPPQPGRILSVSPFADDHAVLRKIIRDSPWRLTTRKSAAEALPELNRSRFTVIFCEFQLNDGNWKDVLDLTHTMNEVPLLVVTSEFTDERLWAEVLNLGGYDLLTKPLVEDEVRRVLLLAMTHQARPARKPRVMHTTC